MPALVTGVFFLFYGITGGFIRKKILISYRTKEYVEGRDAYGRGVFYIVVGVLFLSIIFLALLRELSLY